MSSKASDELVDVVDENGDTIGVVTRRQMRERHLAHRCVYVLVFSSSGKLLIHQRTATKDVYPSYWDVAVGGVLAAGEQFDDAARREVAEELGINVIPTCLFPFNYRDGNTHAFAMAYLCTTDGPFRPQVEEVTQTELVSTSQLKDLFASRKFCPDGVQVWRKYSATRGDH